MYQSLIMLYGVLWTFYFSLLLTFRNIAYATTSLKHFILQMALKIIAEITDGEICEIVS